MPAAPIASTIKFKLEIPTSLLRDLGSAKSVVFEGTSNCFAIPISLLKTAKSAALVVVRDKPNAFGLQTETAKNTPISLLKNASSAATVVVKNGSNNLQSSTGLPSNEPTMDHVDDDSSWSYECEDDDCKYYNGLTSSNDAVVDSAPTTICSMQPDLLAQIVAFLCYNPHHGGQTECRLYVQDVYPLLRSIPGLYSRLSQSKHFKFLQADAEQDHNLAMFYMQMEDAAGDAALMNYYMDVEDNGDIPGYNYN